MIGSNKVVANYLDIPLQHADPVVLKRMGRVGSGEDYLDLIEKLRDSVPGITIRSTFIAGFPGETEEQFEHLEEFLKKAKLDRVGCFAYSEEEGTPAGRMKKSIPVVSSPKKLKPNQLRFPNISRTVLIIKSAAVKPSPIPKPSATEGIILFLLANISALPRIMQLTTMSSKNTPKES